MKIAMLVVMFLLIGAFFIISENNLALNNGENIDKFAGLYASWISGIFDNGRQISGYIVKMGWLPDDS